MISEPLKTAFQYNNTCGRGVQEEGFGKASGRGPISLAGSGDVWANKQYSWLVAASVWVIQFDSIPRIPVQ